MEAATHMQEQPEDDPLGSLEDRIRRTVAMVSTLKAERDAAVGELDSAKRLAATSQAEAQKLRAELDSLRSERKQVRVRIEKLLGQMDLLSGA
jgi:FtsZ-binding cell division protein ZapB